MKRLLFIMLCMIFCSTTFAQTAPEHLTFKGIPIDGNIDSFVEKMKLKGFKHLKTYETRAAFTGSFAGHKDCIIYAESTKDKNVYMVAVMFPKSDSWSDLSTTYFNLKRKLTTKYGEPESCTETFGDYGLSDNDNINMSRLKDGSCEYNTAYRTKNGIIGLTVSHIKENFLDICCVTLLYADATNILAKESEDIDDL